MKKRKKKCNSGVSQWRRECIWTAAIVASQQNIDCYYGITGELYSVQRAHATDEKAPRRSGWRPALWCDEIPEIEVECSREIKSDKSFFTADCFGKGRLQEDPRMLGSACLYEKVPLGCWQRSVTSPKSPNGRGRAFMWIMLFILGLSSYISVLQMSTPSQPFSKYFTGFLCRVYYQGAAR